MRTHIAQYEDTHMAQYEDTYIAQYKVEDIYGSA